MRTTKEICAICLLLAVISIPVSAQVTGRITGSVLDPSGSIIPGASVSLMMPGSSAALLTTHTNRDGIFYIVGVRPDSYDLVVESPGFSPHTTSQIKVDPAQELALPAITLTIAATNIKVEVVAGPQTIQAANAEVSTTTTNEQVRKLPALTRSPLNLLDIQAGVSQGAGPVVINGQRASSVSVTLDGIDIRDNYIRTSFIYTPNLIALDQVAEFTVAASNSDSTFGGASSHVVFVTPSGTNALHGSAYLYNSNSALAANGWFNNRDKVAKPSYNQNQIGGSIGGPIKKDKLYFYANYEAYRLPIQPTANRTILTADARKGIFTYVDTQQKVQKVNILEAMGISADSAMEKILASVPGPEKINNYRVGDSSDALLRNTAGYSFLMDGHHYRDNVTGKLDYKLSPAHLFSASFLWNRQDVTRSDLSNDFSTVPKVSNDDSRKLLSIAWRWNRGAGLTNELRGGFNLAPITFSTKEQFGTAIISGMLYSNPVNTFRGQGRNTNTYALMDNAVYVRGKHAIQFGFQTEQIRVRTFAEDGITPTYTLGIGFGNPSIGTDKLPGIRTADLPSANALLATLAGYLTSYSQTFNVTGRTSGFVNSAPNVRNYSLNSYSLYVEDAWKIRPTVTLNFGLRAELPSVVDERDSLALLPIVQNNDPVAALLSNSTIDFAGSAVGRPWYGRDKNNFAPNVGVTWDVTGDGKTVLRGGYTISYVNDETIRAISGSVEYNQGLSASAAATGLSGRVSSGLPQVPTPVFKVPRTFQDNFIQNPYGAFGLPDPRLRTPYVQQWSLGIQRKIKDAVLEIRYVGNHAVKLFRGYDVNPEVIVSNGFLDDFKRARQNGNLSRSLGGGFDPSYNPNIPGSQPLPVFAQLPYGGLLGNTIVRNEIDTGQAGDLAATYQMNRLNGPIAFYANPYSFASILLSNYSNTSYNALQIDIRRRMLSGLQFQANYTYGKVLSDSDGISQDRWEGFRDPSNGQIDRSRPAFDLTHAIKANFIYDLPGGHQSQNRIIKVLLGGWTISGIAGWQSGNPFSVLSKRGTLLRAYRSSENTADTSLDKAELDNILQLRMTSNGPYIVAPSAIGIDGRGVAADGQPQFEGQVFSHPQPGRIGSTQRRWFSGPSSFNLDLAMLKTIRIKEKHSLEFRVESFNVLNHPNWYVGDQDISSTSFGQITSTLNTAREFQLSLHYRF